jgi:hypothetical protein
VTQQNRAHMENLVKIDVQYSLKSSSSDQCVSTLPIRENSSYDGTEIECEFLC